MKRAAIIISAMLVVSAVYAEYGKYDLGEVSVDGSGYSYGINDFARASAVFTGQAFDFGAEANAADILSEVPGVYFLNSGLLDFGAGFYTGSITKIRGSGGGVNSGILTLVDDRPQSMSVFRHPLLDTLALDNADSVEIIKGPASMEYGNMAKNGVIKIRTKIPYQEGMKSKIKATAGSYFTQNYFFSNMMRKGDYDYAVSGGYKSTAGFRPNSESSQQNYSVKTGYAYNNEIRYGGSASYNDVVFYNPGPENAGWDREQEGCRIKTVSWDVRAERNAADFKGKLMFYSDTGSNDFMKSTGPLGVTMPGTGITFANYGARLMEEWNLIPGNVMKIGFDWQSFGGTFKNHPYDPAQKKNEARFENDYSPYFIIAQKVGITGIMLGLRYAYNDQWGHEIVPQAGFTFSLYDGNKIYFNVSKGYATPAMSTVIYSSEAYLKPEDFWQYEAGVEQEFGDFFDLILTAYQTEGQNVLKIDPVDMTAKNNGFTLIRGAEADLSIKIKDIVKIGGSGAYCEPGEKSANVSLLTAKTYLSVSPGKIFSIKAEAEFAKNRYDADKKMEKLDDYMSLNASAYCKLEFLGPDSGIFVEATNLLNTRYEVKKGYPAPGFIIKSGVVIKI
jgi:outer membrane cobalamin receptor